MNSINKIEFITKRIKLLEDKWNYKICLKRLLREFSELNKVIITEFYYIIITFFYCYFY